MPKMPKKYKKYNEEHYFEKIKTIFKNKGAYLKDYPPIWTSSFLKIHNCMITSSVLLEKDIIHKIGYFKPIVNGKEDYDYWLRALAHTNSVYVRDACFYYDAGHGHGQNY